VIGDGPWFSLSGVSRMPLPSREPGRWAGLRLEVDAPARPGLRVEVTTGRRLLLRQGDEVVLLGVQRSAHRGVHYSRTGRFRAPLSPVGAALARRMREPADAWAARWTHWFADGLLAADQGPVHAGRWTLAWGMPGWSVAAHWARLARVDPDHGHITWFGYGDPDDDQRDILPLRRLAGPDADRVRSYRRQVREGVLPPVLLWWVSGMNTLLVLDGHDRISAALAEDAVPEVVVLAPAPDPAWVRASHEQLLRDRRGPGPGFPGQLLDIARSEGRTRAWLLPGGTAAWEAQAGKCS
jgi:hypothetical protein